MPGLKPGINCFGGKLTCPEVGAAFGMTAEAL
jgi:hypothetical protein